MYSLFRNTSNITRPTKGWGQLPGKNDIKPADDIERLRNYRNKICHENSSEMTTKDFNEFVLDFIWVSKMAFKIKLDTIKIKYQKEELHIAVCIFCIRGMGSFSNLL